MADNISVNVGFTEEGLKKIQIGVEQLKEKLLQIKIEDASAKALNNTENAAKKAAKEVEALANKTAKASAQEQAATEKLAAQKDIDAKNNIAQQAKMEKAAEVAAQKAEKVAAAQAKIASELSRPFIALRKQFESVSKSAQDWAFPLMGIQSAVSLITQAFSGLTSALSATAGQAVELETTMGKIQNLVGGGADTKKLTQNVMQLSASFGRSAQDIAMQVRETIALGIADNTDDAMIVVKQALGGAIGTYSDLGATISGSGKLMQVFGLNAENTSEIIAKMSVAANAGSGTMENLSASVGQFATIAAMSGAGLNEVLAAMGVLTKVDDAASAAANMSNIFQKMLNPTDELKTLFEKLGWQSAKTEIQQRGFMNVLKELRVAELKYVGDGKAFRDMQAQKAYGQLLAAQGIESYIQIVEKLGTAEEQLKDKIKLAMSSSEERMKRLKETFNVTLLKIGILITENILPPLLSFAEVSIKVITAIGNIGAAFVDVAKSLEAADLNIITIAATGAAGALIYLNATAIAGLIASIPTLMGLLGTLAASFVAVAAPVVAIAAAFVASYVATRFLVDNINALIDVVTGSLMVAFSNMTSVLVAPFQLMLKSLGMVSDKAEELSNTISAKLGEISAEGKKTFNKASFTIPDFAADLATIKDAANGVFTNFNKTNDAAGKLTTTAKKTAETTKQIIPPSEDWIKAQEAIEKMQKTTVDMVAGLSNAPDKLKQYYAQVLEGERALAEFKKRKDIKPEQIAAYKKQIDAQAKIYKQVLTKSATESATDMSQTETEQQRTAMDKQIADLQAMQDNKVISEKLAQKAIESLRQKQYDREIKALEDKSEYQIRLDENVDDERRAKTRNVATGVVGQVRDKSKEDKEAADKEKAKSAAQQGVVEGFSAARSGVGSFMTFVASKFGFVGQIISGVIELLSSPEAAKTFVDSFFGAGIWQFVQQILNNIGSVLVKGIIENLPKAVTALTGFLTLGIPEFVANLIAGIADGLIGMLAQFGDTKLWDGMAKSMFNAFKKAINSIKNLFKGIFGGKTSSSGPSPAAAMPTAVGTTGTSGGKDEFAIREYALGAEGSAEDSAQSEQDSMKSIWGDFLDWLKKGWEQVRDVAKEIGNFITTWIVPVDLIKAGVKEIGNLFNSIKNSAPFQLISSAFSTMLSFMTAAWNGFKSIFNIGNIWQSVQNTFDSFIGYIKNSWNLLKSDFSIGNIWIVIQNGFDNLKNNVINGWATVKQTFNIDRIFDAVSNSFNSLVTLVQNTWQSVKNILKLDDIFDKIKAGYTNLKDDILATWGSIKNLFNFGNIWQYVIDTFNSFVGYIKSSWNLLKSDFSFSNIWAVIQTGFDNLKNNILSGWATVKSTLNIGRIFDALGDSFDSIKTRLLSGWEYVKSIFTIKNPFEALENGWNKLVGMFSNWGGFDLGSKLKLNIDYKGKGSVENFLGIDFPWANFASGGVVGGSASGGDSERNDKVPALLSPGEFVVPRSAMARQGVPELLNAVMGYSNGGVVKAAKGWGFKRIGAAVLTGGVSEAARAVGLPPPDEYAAVRDTFNSLNSVLGGLDLVAFAKNPVGYIGDVVRSKIGQFANFKQMFGFANGGVVPGPQGAGDIIPAMLSPGELVLNRKQQQQVASQSGGITVNINVAAGATLDRPAIERALPMIIDSIRRQSFNGQQVLSPRGVR
jgi:TP901 family phage tail tape measure protein